MRWTMEWAICGQTELEADSEEEARKEFAQYHILDLALGGELDPHTCYRNEKVNKTKTAIVNDAPTGFEDPSPKLREIFHHAQLAKTSD